MWSIFSTRAEMTDRTEYLVRYGVGGVGRSGSYRSLASPIASRINGKKLGRVPPTKALSTLFLGRLTEVLNHRQALLWRQIAVAAIPRDHVGEGLLDGAIYAISKLLRVIRGQGQQTSHGQPSVSDDSG